MIDTLTQIIILLGTPLAVWLMSDSPTPTKVKWGCIIGLSIQPFWYYTAISNQQFGVLGTTLLFTWVYWNGLKKNKDL